MTSYITGSIDVTENDNNNRKGGGAVGNKDSGADAGGETNRKITSSGIVGIRVYFVHLVKNEKEYDGLIKIKNVFPVNNNESEKLKSTFKRINAKGFRKLFRPRDSEGIVMFRIYDTNEEFIQSRARLQKRIVDRVPSQF